MDNTTANEVKDEIKEEIKTPRVKKNKSIFAKLMAMQTRLKIGDDTSMTNLLNTIKPYLSSLGCSLFFSEDEKGFITCTFADTDTSDSIVITGRTTRLSLLKGLFLIGDGGDKGNFRTVINEIKKDKENVQSKEIKEPLPERRTSQW